MTSVKTNRPGEYRARAKEARAQAATATDEAKRNRLLQDAELWERMAEYEEKNQADRMRAPPGNLQS